MALATSSSETAAKDSKLAPNACSHCGLPVPKGRIEPDASDQFCCQGCATAFQLIRDNGLEAFYSMRDANPVWGAIPASPTARYLEYDQSEFQQNFGVREDGSTREIRLRLDGLHCAACIWLLEKLPRMVPGVLQVQLNWARQSATIRWDSSRVLLSTIAQSLHALGYTPHPVRQNDRDARFTNENRTHLIRIGVAAAAAGNNMLIAAALYLGMFSYMSGGMEQLLRIASCVIGLASLIGPGRIFLQGALNAIRTRTPHMDLPIALGLTTGSLAGIVNTVRGSGEIYFDSLSVLILLLLVGRWIQFRQQSRAADSVEMLYRLTPPVTLRMVNGQAVETFVDLIRPGDRLLLRSGDLVPVDGVIEVGTTEIDESILSGESRWLTRGPGDPVLAGTQIRKSTIEVRAVAIGRETRLSRIVDLVEQATLDKPEIVQWANRIGGQFVIAVIVLAVITFGIWWWLEPAVAIDRAVALLIVACPCALALATPLAISVALGRAARQKIMIKRGDVLQQLDRPGMLWLDKTGTITTGQMQVVDWFGADRFKPAIGQLESLSSHPVARALAAECLSGDQRVQDSGVTLDEEIDGQGVTGQWRGHRLRVGNRTLMQQGGIALSPAQLEFVDQLLQRSLAPCYIAVDGQIEAIAAIGDQIRPDTQSCLASLKSAGWTIGILSGDHPELVRQVAQRLRISPELALGGLSPEDKLRHVQNCQTGQATVLMVGDGVNDSAALAAATVGIAVHQGAEASLAAAPVYLAEAGLAPILTLIGISRSTNRTIRRNFAASLGYNLIGALLATVGWINPLVAAILMPLSSLTVVTLSLTAGSRTRRESP